jgi:hypothetical protein
LSGIGGGGSHSAEYAAGHVTVTIKETMAVHAWVAMDRIEPLLQTMVDLPPMIVIRGSLDRGRRAARAIA